MQIKQYTKVRSLEEAWELNQKRGAVVLGGCCWLRLSPQRIISQAVDISGLGLQEITETEEAFYIGAMVTLRQAEQHEALAACTQGAMKESLCHIVGTQFRNLATIGGSVCGRFGFSDVWTLLLALRARVELYKGGVMTLEEFGTCGAGKDILTRVILPKKNMQAAYASLRLNKTDFPVIACALAAYEDGVSCAVGARPARAQVKHAAWDAVQHMSGEEFAAYCTDGFLYETNMRASAAYRRDMARVLCRRLQQTIRGRDGAWK